MKVLNKLFKKINIFWLVFYIVTFIYLVTLFGQIILPPKIIFKEFKIIKQEDNKKLVQVKLKLKNEKEVFLNEKQIYRNEEGFFEDEIVLEDNEVLKIRLVNPFGREKLKKFKF